MYLPSCITRVAPLAGLLLAPAGAAYAGAFVLNAGGEIDDESGYAVDAGAAWLPTEATSLRAQVARADSSTDLGDFVTSHAVLGLDHSFGAVALSLEGRLREEEDFLEARTLSGAISFEKAGWRFGLSAETRSSDFEPQTFSGEIVLRGERVQISATSTCSLDNTAFGASGSYATGPWRVAAAGQQFDYDDAECELTGITPPTVNRFQRVGRRVLPQVAPRLRAFQSIARSSVTRDSAFLDATVSLAVGYEQGERLWELTWYHDEEQFVDVASDTLLGAVTLPVGDRSDLELRLGATDSELVGTVGFAGVSVFVYLGSL